MGARTKGRATTTSPSKDSEQSTWVKRHLLGLDTELMLSKGTVFDLFSLGLCLYLTFVVWWGLIG